MFFIHDDSYPHGVEKYQSVQIYLDECNDIILLLNTDYSKQYRINLSRKAESQADCITGFSYTFID